jgi:CHASE3 domain sensor protein
MYFRFNRNLQVGYGISILMLVLIGLISYRTVHLLLDSNRAVEHSNLIIQKLEKTISVMKDAETGQRGYLLTGRQQFLEPYNGAYGQAGMLVNEVAQLTKGDVLQQRRMEDIRKILQKRLAILQLLINRYQQGIPVTVTDLDAGKLAMDALRKAINQAENTEQDLLAQKTSRLKRYAFLTPLFIVLAVLLGILISVLSYIRVIRDIREKDRLRGQLEVKEHETATFNEELTAANEELMAINEELLEAREEVDVLNRSLEAKVLLRTKELQESEEETQALNEEMIAINEELAAANEEYRATNEELSQARDQTAKNEKLFRAIARNIPGSVIMVISHDHRVLTLEGDLLRRNVMPIAGRYTNVYSTANILG